MAQNTWNGGVVLGAPVTEWRGVDLERTVTRCWVNDQPGGQGKTGDAMGHPFEALAWLANALARRGKYLRAGEFVFTGSVVETKWVNRGDRVVMEIERLGTVEAVFT